MNLFVSWVLGFEAMGAICAQPKCCHSCFNKIHKLGLLRFDRNNKKEIEFIQINIHTCE